MVPQPWDTGSLQPAARGVSYDVSIPEFLMRSPEQKICYFTSPKSHFELINEQRHRKTYGFGGTGKNEIISALRNHYAPIIVFVKKRRFHLPFIPGSKSRFRAKKKKLIWIYTPSFYLHLCLFAQERKSSHGP